MASPSHEYTCKGFIHFLILSVSCMSFTAAVGRITTSGGDQDRMALLDVKAHITSDPLGALSSWNSTAHICDWYGVTCGDERVTELTLINQKLRGSLSPSIGNLTFLRALNLSRNYLFGKIPPEIGRLQNLLYLNLSRNSFLGEIPSNISQCQILVALSLGHNKLEGNIPPTLSSMEALVILSLIGNQLTGKIPDPFCNFSSNLNFFSIASNNLHGSVPGCLSRIPMLQYLLLSSNYLSGEIPSAFFNLSTLAALQVANNNLHGNLPSDLFLTLPNLQSLIVGKNQLMGTIPSSLANASQLLALEVGRNSFTGHVPRNLGRLKSLLVLGLAKNQLGSYGEDDDLGFLQSLVNCTRLTYLAVADNHLGGDLPKSISNLSIHLESLYLHSNFITGSLPPRIDNLASLTVLSMWNNSFSGSIPPSIGMLHNLEGLDLNKNNFSGAIPFSIGNLTKLLFLSLYENNFHGTIPRSLGNCRRLAYIDLSGNRLNGTLPHELLNMPSLLDLNLSSNFLSGTHSSLDVGSSINLLKLDISGNKIQGEISTTIGSCLKLEYLYLGNNMLQGSLPQSLANIQGIRVLTLGHNNLTGNIPAFLEKLRFLEYLDLSFNECEGEVPTHGIFSNASAVSMVGNRGLCAGILELKLPTCHGKTSKGRNQFHLLQIAAVVAVILIATFILAIYLFVACHYKRKPKQSQAPLDSLEAPFPMISYSELFRATNGFSFFNVIGSGTYGTVYKGSLKGWYEFVAIKVLNLSCEGAVKSFHAECSALRNIRHRNLLKIKTICSSIDFRGEEFKALVFQFMPNGNLDQWLHQGGDDNNRPQLRKLALLQKLNIAIDVACALDYLHNHCLETIIHRDLKPSNVLLDGDMAAHVADFGMARFLHESAQQTISTCEVKGSLGYVAPEYGVGGRVSTDGDVYSFGILLLEMLIGKRPTDVMFKEKQDLHQHAKNLLGELEILRTDSSLLYEVEQTNNNTNHMDEIHRCITSMLEIGISCSMPSPNHRMKIKDVLSELLVTRNRYMENEAPNQKKRLVQK